MSCFVRHIGAEISSHETMPVSIVLTIQLILQVRCYFLDGVHFVEGVLGNRNNLGLHFWVDIFDLYDRLTFPEISHSNFNISFIITTI